MTRDRVTELRRVKASELIDNPKNWRDHPQQQRDAMVGILEEVGIVDAVKAFETADGLMLFDGHLRKDIAADELVPVLVVDLSPEEADVVLASFDRLSKLAQSNDQQLQSLLAEIEPQNEQLRSMLDQLNNDSLAAQLQQLQDAPDAEQCEPADSSVEQPSSEYVTFQVPVTVAQELQIRSKIRLAKRHFDVGQSGAALVAILETWQPVESD